MDNAIANKALELAMAWGADWMTPTQPRLKALHAELSDAQLDEYDTIAQAAMTLGFKHMYDSPSCERQQLATVVRARFSWVSDANLSRMHGQGTYYASR